MADKRAGAKVGDRRGSVWAARREGIASALTSLGIFAPNAVIYNNLNGAGVSRTNNWMILGGLLSKHCRAPVGNIQSTVLQQGIDTNHEWYQREPGEIVASPVLFTVMLGYMHCVATVSSALATLKRSYGAKQRNRYAHIMDGATVRSAVVPQVAITDYPNYYYDLSDSERTQLANRRDKTFCTMLCAFMRSYTIGDPHTPDISAEITQAAIEEHLGRHWDGFIRYITDDAMTQAEAAEIESRAEVFYWESGWTPWHWAIDMGKEPSEIKGRIPNVIRGRPRV